jgi:hypothetical protein
MVPVEVLLQPSASTAASVELDGAVLTADRHLLARPDGFAAVVDAPAGTLVLAGGSTLESYQVGADLLTLDFVPPRNDEAGEFGFSVLAVLPDGRVLLEEWNGSVVSEAPALSATSATTAFALGAQVRGAVEPYVQLLVDGRPVEVNTDGSFEVAVDVPPWPRDVVVAARDPFGNETSLRVQAIGFLDYRGLPWIPITGLATVLVGAYVFLRIPRPPAARAPMLSDDATLEEIEAD